MKKGEEQMRLYTIEVNGKAYVAVENRKCEIEGIGSLVNTVDELL